MHLFLFFFLFISYIPIHQIAAFPLTDIQSAIHLVSGTWVESTVDLSTPGTKPLELKRTFASTARDLHPMAFGWQFNLPDFGKVDSPRHRLNPPKKRNFQYSYDDEHRLTKIQLLHETTKQVEGFFTLDYQKDSCTVCSNTGEKAIYGLTATPAGESLLTYVETPHSRCTYTYVPHPFERTYLIDTKKNSQGELLKFTYYETQSPRDFKTGRLKEIHASRDEGVNWICLYFLDYTPRMTSLIDSSNVLTKYHYNDCKEIEKIETFLPKSNGHALYRTLELEWQGGNLIKKTIKDSCDQIMIQERFIFDKNNLIEEYLEGTLTQAGMGWESSKKQYVYDADNRLIEEINQEGLTIHYLYKGQCIRAQLTKDNGTICKRSFFSYDDEDRCTAVFHDDGSSPHEEDLSDVHERTFEKTTHNCLGLPLEIIKGVIDLETGQEICLNRQEMTYGACGRIEKKVDGDFSEHYSYGQDGELKEILDSNGVHTRFFPQEKRIFYQGKETITTYSPQKKIVKEESFANGLKTGSARYHYNSLNQLVGIEENESTQVAYFYDPQGRKIQELSPEVLDINGLPTSFTRYYTYDPLDRIIEIGSENGMSKHISYNVRGDPLLISYPDGSFEEKRYFLNGQLKMERLSDGTSWNYTYDACGRLKEKVFKDAKKLTLRSSSYFYTGALLAEEVFSSGISIRHIYDKTGRKISSESSRAKRKITYADEKPPSPQKATPEDLNLEFIQNERGQTVLQETKQLKNGMRLVYRYDALKHLEQIKRLHPDGSSELVQTLYHDAAGRKIKEIFHLPSVENLWNYDTSGRLITLIEAAGTHEEKTTHYSYLPGGKLEKEILPNGIELLYSYGFCGKLCRLQASDQSLDYELFYNSEGQLIEIKDHIHSSISTRTYDINGQVTQEILANGLCLQNTYDDLGKRIRGILPDLSEVEYRFEEDRIREIIRKNQAGSPLYSYSYIKHDAKGRPLESEMILGLGTVHYGYNEEGRLSSVHSPYFSQKNVYDEEKRLICLQTTDSEGYYENHYAYSHLGLIQDNEKSYIYDSFENRLDNHSNALGQVFSHEHGLEYDLNGNLIKKIQDGALFGFSYDPLNRLTEVKMNGKLIHSYVYDIFHRRLSDKAASVHFIYDGNWEMGTTDLNGNITSLRIFEPSLESEHAACIAFEWGTQVFAPLYHLSGSVASLISTSDKKPVESYRYGAFGEPHEKKFLSPWTFANKRQDPLSRLIHFGRRDYDPFFGRFLTQDPLVQNGPNRYAYLHNDPLNFRDYFGLAAIDENEVASKNWAFEWLNTLAEAAQGVIQFLKSHASLSYAEVFKTMVGDGFLLLSGYYPTETASGVYGHGEVDNKVRVSFINGILTDPSHFESHIKKLSESHGNVNIHWVYRPTKGWIWDIGQSLAVCLGLISDQATSLAESWKNMIQDMGGIDGGGKIIHYAHSIGSVESMRALSLLSQEEQKLVHIYAFGSPSLAIENPAYQIHHFVSIHDGVSLINYIAYFQARIQNPSHVIFAGSFIGIPLIDHFFGGQTYQDLWKSMGRTFMEWYGSIAL